MNVLGFQLTRAKATSVPLAPTSFWGIIRESFPGAWQRNITLENHNNILAFSAVYACVALISEDIAKLRVRLIEQREGVWTEVDRSSPYWPVLVKPNEYQTRIQFIAQWIISKLLYGNTYVLLEREIGGRRIVRNMYVLDPRKVTPLIADDGSVWYRLNQEELVKLRKELTVPASEIIHDRGPTLFHPLVGVSPIYACGASATTGIRIQSNSEQFFRNNSAPSGHLTSPHELTNETATRLKEQFERDFSGNNYGRLLVTGGGLAYEAFTMPAVDAQLIEQLKWTVEDVGRAFRVPLHKIASGVNPTFNNVAALNQDYYSQTLQSYIEALELLLEEGLGLRDVADRTYSVDLDLDGLLRMDPVSRMEVNEKGTKSGILMPNEARARENLSPREGGDQLYMQEQNWPLSLLSKRKVEDLNRTPMGDPVKPAPKPAPAKTYEGEVQDVSYEDEVKLLGNLLAARFQSEAIKLYQPVQP